MKNTSRRTLKLRRYLAQLIIMSFIATIVWIGFEIYSGYNQQPNTNFNQLNLDPVDPNLYIDDIVEFNQRQDINQSQLQSFSNQLSTQPQIVSSQPDIEQETNDSSTSTTEPAIQTQPPLTNNQPPNSNQPPTNTNSQSSTQPNLDEDLEALFGETN